LGAKAFEQCAGFLRIVDGDNPLDASTVHPEAYPVVEQILQHYPALNLKQIMGNISFIKTLNAKEFTSEKFGLPTVQDILQELEKPGRDPRPEFKSATFKEGVETLKDLKLGMVLEGVVTNVANFGAFVDIGVHQDGLVHLSQITQRFIKDPREVVKAGDVVKVKVIDVDEKRNRISLSMRLEAEVKRSAPPKEKRPNSTDASSRASQRKEPKKAQQISSTAQTMPQSALGLALANALGKQSI